jgi:ubiquinone biosynthesis protein
MAAEELGPTFIKLAQVLSNRPDLLPDPLIKEIEKLQDTVTPFSFNEVKKTIESGLSLKINELFEEFNETPIASASIGQVHRAKLLNGDDVVVKVRRPNIKEKVEQDIAIIHDAVRRTNRYLKKQGILNAQEIVDLFERTMAKELDFQTEARNLERFKKLFKDNKKIYIPSCYKELSSEQVLIMEYIDAVKITDSKQIKAWGLSVTKILETGMDLYLTMIFEKGVFHADPHPGNVLVRSDGTICLIDFGMVGKLMPKDKYAFAGVFIGLAKQDARYMANSLRKLAIEHEIHDMRQFEYDLDDVIEDFSDQDVSEGSLSDLTIRLQDVMFRYRIKAPGSVFLIFRCFIILEGIGKQLHPNFNTYDAIKPYGAKIIKEQLSPANLYRNLEGRFNEFSSMVSSFPNEVKVIMKKARQGKLHFQVEHQGYGYLLKKMDSITNRIVLSIIISSLIVASAITMTMEMGPDLPTYKGLPQISITFLTIAGWISLILAYSVIRRRKYK